MNKTTTHIKELITYKNRSNSLLMRYIYNETDYEEMKIFLSIIKKKTNRLLNDPSLLFNFY